MDRKQKIEAMKQKKRADVRDLMSGLFAGLKEGKVQRIQRPADGSKMYAR